MEFAHNEIGGSRRGTLLGCLLLLTFLMYANSLVNGFIYDDHTQIEQSPYVHNLKNAAGFFWTSQLANQGRQEIKNYYRPLTNLGFLLCYQLFGAFAPGFHLASVLMHCLVVWLVYAVTAELTGDGTFGLIAAACFALHPIHTEAADWIDGVSDLEMSIFYLSAFWLFLRLGREETRRKLWVHVAMLSSFVLAALSKETAMTLPVLATVYEHCCRGDRQETGWTEKVSRYGGFWVTGLVYLVARGTVLGGVVPVRLHADIGVYETVLTTVGFIGKYAAKLIWPAPLVAFYPFEKSTRFFDPWVLLGVAVLAAGAAFLVFEWKRDRTGNRLYFFALPWMLLTLAPVLNVHWMTAIVFAERYLYLPSVGFCWLVAGAVLWCWRRSGDSAAAVDAAIHGTGGMGVRRWALVVAAGVVALLFAGETVARNRDWRNDGTLDARTLEVYPQTSYLRSDVGMGIWRSGNHAEGMRQWQIALAYQPDQPEALADIGFAMLEEKKYAEAIPPLQKAIALSPLFATPHVHLARVYAALGENEQAEAELARAIEILPLSASVRNAAGQFYLETGRPREAQTEFLTSVTIDANNEPGWAGLAESYGPQDGPEKAALAWQQVVAHNPFDSHAHLALARIYRATGRAAEAEKEFESCLLTDPRNTEALAAVQQLRPAPDPPTSP